MELSDRKKKILSAVIETNIKSKQTEAVSSKWLQEEYLPKVSSATIRNELNALEEMGYLTHLHTSSGRVPTKEGYEKYINELMHERKLTEKEKMMIKSNFSEKLLTIRDIIERSAQTITKATNYTSIVYSGPSKYAIIKDIKLYPVSKTTQLVVVVTNERVINEIANLGTNDGADLNSAASILKDLFENKPISLVKDKKFRNKVVNKELKKYQAVFDKVLEIIEANNEAYKGNYTVAGKDKLIDSPEFNDVGKVKKALTLFDNTDAILPIISKGSDVELSINVGSDDAGLEDCSIVTVSCNIKGEQKITAGVIGPMRMDYPKAVSVLKEVAETIENALSDEGEWYGRAWKFKWKSWRIF